MKKVMYVLLILCLFCVPGIRSKAMQISENESPTIDSYVLKTDLTFKLTEENSIVSVNGNFIIPYFKDVTYLELQYETSQDSVDFVDMRVQVNNIELTKLLTPSMLDQERYIVMIDSHAEMDIMYPKNTFSMVLNASFANRLFFNAKGFLDIIIHQIVLKTVYQNDPIVLLSTDDNDVRKEATIIPNNYYEKIKSSLVNIYLNTLIFNLVLPREINESYIVNLTVRSNVEVEYRHIFLESFGIQRQSSENLTHFVEFHYVDKVSRSLSQLQLDIFPVSGRDFFLEIEGYFKITVLKEPFPSSQFDFILFFIVTAVVPPTFLSKLFYKRLRNMI